MDVSVLERELLLRVFFHAADLVDLNRHPEESAKLQDAVIAYRNLVRVRKEAEKAIRASQYANVAGEL